MNAPKKEHVVKKEDSFTKNILENVVPQSTFVLGVSGGADSVYLFFRCLQLQNKFVVAHVNHGLRGKNSINDEKFVKNLCKKNGVKFYRKHLHLKKFSEEIARDARYKFYEEVRKKAKAQWILTAHHLNDNIETMLFNLIRGAHFNGIKGMTITSPSRHLLRPLLGITKKVILAKLKSEKIPYRRDESNNNTDFSRNLLRKKIVPLFVNINPNFEQTFKETIHNFSQTNQYLEKDCEEWLKKNTENAHIDLQKFLNTHAAFQKLLLTHLYKRHHKSTKKLTNKHLEEVLQTLKLRQSGKKKEFGPDTFLQIARDPKKSTHYIRLIAKK